ncbi:hypothetical protein ACHAXR_009404 [Thalassiosira sp. AJA248-18]
MNNSNPEKTPASAKLDGFAPAAGAGATSAAAAAGGGTVGESIAAPPPAPAAKKPAPSSAAAAAAATQTKKTKKRGPKKGSAAAAGGGTSATTSTTTNNDTEEKELRPLSEIGGSTSFEPLSLAQIQLRLKTLLDKLPKELPDNPSDYDSNATAESLAANTANYAPIKSFASSLQVTIEEYNLLLSLVSCATYRWGVDRSGASQQNLGVMSAELQTCQEIISNVVSARLSNVLCPAVDVLIGEVEIVRGAEGKDDDADGAAAPAKKRKLNEDRLSTATNNNNERRVNHYTRPLVDPSYVHLCHCILVRNAPLIRHTVATSIHTAQRVIGDYLNAMKKDTSHEAGKGGYY